MNIYDKADWHAGGDGFPEYVPQKCAATHIAFFIVWAIQNNIASAPFSKDCNQGLEKLLSRQITPGAFFLEYCDGVFSDNHLTSMGNDFTKFYYENNLYLDDYEKVLGQNLASLYEVKDTWDNFDLMAATINKQWLSFSKKGSSSWLFWKK